MMNGVDFKRGVVRENGVMKPYTTEGDLFPLIRSEKRSVEN